MSFVAGVIIGMSIGIGLMVAYARYTNIRSSRRSQLVTLSIFVEICSDALFSKFIFLFCDFGFY